MNVITFLDLENIFVTFGILDKEVAQQFLNVSLLLLKLIMCTLSMHCYLFY